MAILADLRLIQNWLKKPAVKAVKQASAARQKINFRTLPKQM